MATAYPGALDTSGSQLRTDIASTDDLDASGKEHDVMHVNVHGATIALETKLGIGSTTAAGASTSHVLVKQADGDTEWAAVPASTPTAITVADTTDTSCSVAVFESATGDLGPKTDGGLTYNAGTGMLTATGLTGPLTGNASGTALTVTQAAQTAITSVGTLTALTVNGVLTVSGAGNGILLDGLNSSNANTLDDYEEGYWTCALTASSSGSITVNTGSDQGAYTKVGRVVHIQGLFTVSAVSSPAGTLRVGGLPFTAAPSLNESADRGSNMGTVINLANAKSGIHTHVHANTTFMDMNAGAGGTVEDASLADDVDTGSYFLISGSYIASA